MTHHDWGDNWEHWDMLVQADRWICKFYSRLTSKRPITKEKYGTIRYEFEFMWLKNKEDTLKFCEILKRATHKFHPVASEIVCDFITVIEPTDAASAYYYGYFEGIYYGKDQGEWRTYPRQRPFMYTLAEKNKE